MGQRKLLVTALNLALVGMCFSAKLQAQDGDLGETSAAKVGLSLEVTDSVLISALDSLDFGTYGGADTGDLNHGDEFCVYVKAAINIR